MPKTSGQTRYTSQRERVTPPYIALGDVRTAVGWTIDALIERLHDATCTRPKHDEHCHRYSRGAISAVENGHRGASAELLEAMSVAYGLRPGAVTTTYRPRGAEVAA